MRLLLAGFLTSLWLIGAAWVADWRPTIDVEAQRQAAVQSPDAWLTVLAAAGRHLGLTLAVFALGGLLVGGLGYANRRDQRMPFWLLTPFAALVVAFAAGWWARVDGAPMLPWVMLHAAVGAWAGLTGALLLSGRHARKFGLVLLLLPLVVGAAAAIRIGTTAMATEPLPVDSPEVTAQQKRALAERLRHPGTVDAEKQIKELRLSETELNRLLAIAVAMHGDRLALNAALEPDHAYIQASRRAERTGGQTDGQTDGQPRYQTAGLGLGLRVTGDETHLAITSARVGDFNAPDWLLHAAMPDLLTALRREPRVRELLAATERLHLSDDGLAVRIRGNLLANDFLNRLAGEDDPGLTDAAGAYAQHLLEVGRNIPMAKRELPIFLAALFDRAAERTGQTGDPVRENRAALLALGVVVGHVETQRLTGELLRDPDDLALARNIAGTVRVRGRNDWARHFAISAMLTVLANETLSDAVGVFKEEIDSAGGSGFSFADLLADRAGTRLAARATTDDEQARAMQDLLRDNEDQAAFFPEAGDLPEGIPDAQLQSEYGGVGGKKYQQVMRTIESRLDQTPALR